MQTFLEVLIFIGITQTTNIMAMDTKNKHKINVKYVKNVGNWDSMLNNTVMLKN